jgi:DNA-binding CsgD family transcriptional regulator
MSGVRPGSSLRGRRSECEVVDRRLRDVRAGRSAVLVLRGEAGVGKSALLDYALESAGGCRVARAAGVESEMELPYAGLHQLCAPMLGRLELLPDPQRGALQVAFGLSEGDAPDRFLVALAVLNLLSGVAEERPLLCLVDDAQWLDRASAQALAFAARRLLAEPLGMLFAVREPSDDAELGGLPKLLLEGIADDDARRLLQSTVHGRLDEQVAERIVAETRGNPLALLELPRAMTPAELAGGFGLLDSDALASCIEESFLRQLESLSPETRRLLLTAAAEPLGDVTLLWRAAERLGLSFEAAAPAQSAGLIHLGPRLRFRHPLVRSAVYGAATPADRRGVHRALAEATDRDADPDRRAWHRAHAASGPDEAVAVELERSAGRAQRRGGIAAAAAFLEHATELTPDPARRGARALDAARAKWASGAPQATRELLAIAEMGPLDELQRAWLERVRARIALAWTRGTDAPALLLAAARRFGALDARLARDTYLEALGAAMFRGRLGREHGVREVAEAARAAPPPPEPARATDLLLDALAARFSEGYGAAVPPLRQAMEAFRHKHDRGDYDSGWLLACRIAPDLWDDEAWHELASTGLALARDAGALTMLPIALHYRGGVHVHASEFNAAAALVDEADGISNATGTARFTYTSMVLAGWRGDPAHAIGVIQASVQDAAARGEGRAIALADYATAVLHNGLGRYEHALAAAQRGCEHDDLGLCGWSLVELIEAGARSGKRDVACDALHRLEARTGAAGTDWALGVEACSRALLSTSSDAESLYREALERLTRTRMAVHLARVHLLYGEWLRREGRRVDAREHLRLAHDTFSRAGAEAFGERTRRELLATGETVRKPTERTLDQLTSQEAQIARLARNGGTNAQIGAELFISPRTVEYHLHKVFTKLDISSRRELREALPDDERAALPMSSTGRAVLDLTGAKPGHPRVVDGHRGGPPSGDAGR